MNKLHEDETCVCPAAPVILIRPPEISLAFGWGVSFHGLRPISALCLAAVSPRCDLWSEMHDGDSPSRWGGNLRTIQSRTDVTHVM